MEAKERKGFGVRNYVLILTKQQQQNVEVKGKNNTFGKNKWQQ